MEYHYKTASSESLMIDQHFQMHNEEESPVQSDLIIPDCTPGLMYIEQGGLWRTDCSGSTYLDTGKLFLFGQKTRAVEYRSPGCKLKAFGIKLHPASTFSRFGIAAHEINDSVIELNIAQAKNAKIIDTLTGLKKQAICLPSGEVPGLLTQILRDIHHSKGQILIQELLEKYKVGYKKVQRIFGLHIGVTPKLYTRIIRFNHSIRLGSQQLQNLTDIAYQSGYFDQNHFIKEIKHFTGKIPSAIFKPSAQFLEKNHLKYLQQRTF